MYQLLKGLKYLHDRLISHRGTHFYRKLLRHTDVYT